MISPLVSPACLFCRSRQRLTTEHLLSRPICDTFGIDRRSTVGEFGLTGGEPDVQSMRFVDPETMKVRLACGGCNNGWMARLEEEAAEIFGRFLAGSAIPTGGTERIVCWLATRLMVWSFRDGGARQLMTMLGSRPCAIPNYRRAFALGIQDGAALDGLLVGATRGAESPGYAFGNASTPPSNRASFVTSVLVLNLPPVQLWIADCHLDVPGRLPDGLEPLVDGQPLGRLPKRALPLQPGAVSFTFTDETVATMSQALAAAAGDE